MNTVTRHYYVLFLIMVICSCQKNTQLPRDAHPGLITEAKVFFNCCVDSKSTSSSATPNRISGRSVEWQGAKEVYLSFGKAVVVPVKHQDTRIIRPSFSSFAAYRLDDIVKLVFYKDASGAFNVNVLTFLPDSNHLTPQGAYTGFVLVEKWDGTPLYKLMVNQNEKPRISYHQVSQSMANRDSVETVVFNDQTATFNYLTVCRYFEGFNYSASDPNGYHWSEFLGCDTYYVASPQDMQPGDYGGGDLGVIGGVSGGASASGMSPANNFSVVAAPDPITNFDSYKKCFSNVPGSTNSYQVMICVSQPDPGTRETWGVAGAGTSSPLISVGHTFLVLNEITPTGTITRNVGFYPRGAVTPMSPTSQGQLSNDANQDFDVAVNIQMTSSQFFQILDFLAQGNFQGYQYDLNSNNCTTFALNALGSAGIQMPRTSGTWLNGKGLNPGDLGEDLRSMDLPSNMKRMATTGSHPNRGECYN